MSSSKQPTASTGLHLPSPTEFNLSQIRLKCKDILGTVFFYQTLGMHVTYRHEFATKDGKRTIVSMGFSHQPETYLVFEHFEETLPQPATTHNNNNNLGSTKQDLGGGNSNVLEKSISGKFQQQSKGHSPSQHDQQNKPHDNSSSLDNSSKSNVSNSNNNNQSNSDSSQQQHTYQGSKPSPLLISSEYLVMYVQLISRLYTLLLSKGFKLLLSPIDVSDTKIVIFEDPNGLQVRLQEISELQSKISIQQLIASKSSVGGASNNGGNNINSKNNKSKGSQETKRWSAKLGFYVFPTNDIYRTVHFYSLLFSYSRAELENAMNKNGQDYVPVLMKNGGQQQGQSKPAKIDISKLKGGEVAGKGQQQGNDDWTKVSNADASILQKLKLAGTKRPGTKYLEMNADVEGFKVVDTEDFLIGLSRTIYAWMANGPRSHSFSLCFIEKMDAGDGRTQVDYGAIRKQSPLISFGFQVKNLDIAVDRARTKVKNLKYEQERNYVHGWGVVQDLHDTINKLPVTLFCHKADYEQHAKRGDTLLEMIRKAKSDGVRHESEKQQHPSKSRYTYEVNLNHLSGQARNMSEAALVAKPIDMTSEEDHSTNKAKSKWYDRMNKLAAIRAAKQAKNAARLNVKEKVKSKSAYL